jgi:hippurate hydrolase
MNAILDPAILEAIEAASGEFIDLRRDIHRHPELGFQEHRTSALVAARLRSWGYEVDEGLGGTGVVGTLRRGNGTRSLGIRADMDALPIAEASGRPWASTHPGLMHACGHDGHTATLLAAARRLAEQGRFSGTLHLIFQPAEEGLGGAVRMIEDGLFERHPCDAIFGLHNAPGVPQGHLVFRDGPMMASSDTVRITLTGRGGHGAMPHRAADPVVAAAAIVMALQTVVSRNVDPQQAAVVTVGAIHGGEAPNVIPESVSLALTVRALDREVRQLLERRITEIVQTQAASFGVQAEVDYQHGYAVLVNTPAETDFARQVALELFGAERVTLQGPPITASEDFAFMLEKRPGCYLMVGNGDGPSACMVHNPAYDFNDDNIAVGAAYWVALTQRWLRD